MKLPFQPCKDKSCLWGGWRGKKWHCCCDPAQYGMCSSGGDRPKKNAAVAQNTSTNKPMVAALDDIRAIVFGRGDSVTKVQKVQDRITRLNVTKA